MSKEKTIRVCTGIGMNMFFPDYVEIKISEEKGDEDEVVESVKKITRKRKKTKTDE
jgi:hypothetical protein